MEFEEKIVQFFKSQRILVYSLAVACFVILFFCALLPSRRADIKKYKLFKVSELLKSAQKFKEASLQDSNAIVRVMHANYAQAYFNAARILASDDEIQDREGIDMEDFIKDLENTEREGVNSLGKLCKKSN